MKHEFVRQLRRDQSALERRLWHARRNRLFDGFEFRRQQPIGPGIAGFACFGKKFVIEPGGGRHALAKSADYDARRTDVLERQGYKAIRFWNADLIGNFNGILDAIWRELQGAG